MIYSRRAIQRRLTELRPKLDGDAADQLIRRLNSTGQDQLAAMWEVIILHALAEIGQISHELALPSGRRPDISFRGIVSFIADVTAVSDDGLDRLSPAEELGKQLQDLSRKLGLPIGGIDIAIEGRREKTKRGARTQLRLPSRERLPEFLHKHVAPLLRKQISEQRESISFSIKDGENAFGVSIDQRKSPYNSMSYPAYDWPTIKDQNPLFNALKSKVRQLRGAEGLTGIIVCDGDCKALADRSMWQNQISAEEIIRDFLRQNSSISFVLALSVHGSQSNNPWRQPDPLRTVSLYIPNGQVEVPKELEDIFERMLKGFPRPSNSPVNGRYRSHEEGYGLGYHGGWEMSGSKLRISSRQLVEVLAGRITAQEMNEQNSWFTHKGLGSQNRMLSPFVKMLGEGRLPKSFRVISEEDGADDWIEIEMGDPDPSVSQFR